jgi:hypothetical protein
MNTLFLGIIGGLILLIIILFWMVIRINRRVSDFTRGNEGVALEEVIKELIKDHEESVIHHNELVKKVSDIHNRVLTSHRGFGMIKFNAYENTGGNQSFSCVLLDENGRGMVLSNLYSRERSNLFAKPIIDFKSDLELIKEEQQALQEAITNLRAV